MNQTKETSAREFLEVEEEMESPQSPTSSMEEMNDDERARRDRPTIAEDLRATRDFRFLQSACDIVVQESRKPTEERNQQKLDAALADMCTVLPATLQHLRDGNRADHADTARIVREVRSRADIERTAIRAQFRIFMRKLRQQQRIIDQMHHSRVKALSKTDISRVIETQRFAIEGLQRQLTELTSKACESALDYMDLYGCVHEQDEWLAWEHRRNMNDLCNLFDKRLCTMNAQLLNQEQVGLIGTVTPPGFGQATRQLLGDCEETKAECLDNVSAGASSDIDARPDNDSQECTKTEEQKDGTATDIYDILAGDSLFAQALSIRQKENIQSSLIA